MPIKLEYQVYMIKLKDVMRFRHLDSRSKCGKNFNKSVKYFCRSSSTDITALPSGTLAKKKKVHEFAHVGHVGVRNA